MARLRVRLALALVGGLVFATYATVAALAVGALAFLVVDPPDVLFAAGLFVATTLAVTYLSYRVGTAQVIAGIDALELTGERAPRLTASVERLSDEMRLATPTFSSQTWGCRTRSRSGRATARSSSTDRCSTC